MSVFKKFILKETFQPSLLSLFFNPFYLIRRGLYTNIKKQSPNFKGRLLDFGCGSKPYKNLFLNANEYIGVDYEPIEASKNPDIDIFYDGKTLPFPDEYFDGIFCTEVVEHIFNIEDIFPELNRVLKKDGLAFFTFPFSWPEHAQPYDYARYTTFSSKFIFEKYQFKVCSIEKSGNFIEVIYQYIIFYLFSIIPIKSTAIKMVCILPFSIIFNLLGIFSSFILPKQKDLYFNNIVVVKK